MESPSYVGATAVTGGAGAGGAREEVALVLVVVPAQKIRTPLDMSTAL